MKNPYLQKALAGISTSTNNFPMYKIRFADNTDTALATKRLTDRILLHEYPEAKRLQAAAREQGVMDGNPSIGMTSMIAKALEAEDAGLVQDTLSETVSQLASAYTQAIEFLKNSFVPEVDGLVTEITETVNKQLNVVVGDDGRLVDTGDVAFSSVDLKFVANTVDNIERLTELLHTKANIFDVTSNTVSTKPSLTHATAIGSTCWRKISGGIPEEFRDGIKTRVCTTLSPEMSVDILDYINILLARDTIFTFSKLGESVNSLVFFVSQGIIVVRAYEDLLSEGDFSAEKAKTYRDILDTLQWNLDVAAYILWCVPDDPRFSDILLFTPNLVNVPVFEKFKAAGGTEEVLSDFIRLYYNENPNDIKNKFYGQDSLTFPANGVNYEYILSKIPDINLDVAQITSIFERNLFISRKHAIENAVYQVLTAYTATLTPTGEFSDEAIAQYKKYVVSAMIRAKNSPDLALEPIVSDFVFNVKYPNHISQVVYGLLGAEYAKLFERDTNPTNKKVMEADLTCICDVIVEFIVTYCCKLVK